ncbi:MAG: methyltransferase [Gemmatimonadota bacterium]
MLALKQTIRDFENVCAEGGVRAVLLSGDEVFRADAQPVRTLDFALDDVDTALAGCRRAAWHVLNRDSVLRNGIVLRLLSHGAARNESRHAERPPPAPMPSRTACLAGLMFDIAPGVYEPDAGAIVFVRHTLAAVDGTASPIIIDVGTGSGALAIALAVARPDARIIATDVAAAAIVCASANARRHGTANIELLHGSLLDVLPSELHGSVDVVLANLPWISPLEIAVAELENAEWRGPLHTVRGSDVDGLGLLRAVARQAVRALRAGGSLVLTAHPWQLELLATELASDYEVTYPEDEQLITARLRASARPLAP